MDKNYIITDKRAARSPSEADQDDGLDQERLDRARRDLLAEQAAADDSDPVSSSQQRVLTAFLVTIDYEGNVQATNQLELVDELAVGRPASFPDMYAAAAIIQKDITNQEAAMRVMATLHNTAMQARESKAAQTIADRLRIH